MLVFMPLQTGLEEIVFRGYLLQGMSQVFKNGIVPLLITSILFGTAHISNPEVKEYGFVTMLSYYIGFALFLGVLTLLDEGIELAFGIHFANNIVSGILVTEAHSVIKPYSIFETKVNDPKAEIILWFCMTAVTFTIFYLKYRWKNFSLLIK
jgi:membrane protease YdiL (CAAX protease family)